MSDIRSLRRRLGLTQAQLADRLGVGQATVSRLENERWEPRGPVAILLEQLEDEAAGLPDLEGARARGENEREAAA